MFEIIFIDNTKFRGKPLNSKWNEMPQKSIKKITYQMGDKTVILENYHAYNHLVEIPYNVIQGNLLKCDIYLMAKKFNDVLLVHYNGRKDKIKFEPKEFGKELRNQPTCGWKPGIASNKPRFNVI